LRLLTKFGLPYELLRQSMFQLRSPRAYSSCWK